MDEKNITINISTLTILKFLGIIAVVLFAYFIGDILLMVFIAIIFAALIEPPVSYLERKRIPRALGIFLIYLILFLFLVLVIRLLIPPIAEQIGLFIQNFPGFWEQISQNYLSIKEYSQQQGLLDNVMSGLKGLQSGLQQAATGVYGFIIAIFENLVNFIMILVITFYLVVEKDVMDRVLRAIAPARYHDHLSQLFTAIQKKIGDWARGQLILGLIIGVLSFIGLIILLPKYALVLALVAGITELVPYIGPILGAIPAVFLGFAVPPVSFGRGLAVLILYIIIQQVENNIIVPQVMKKSVGLNPVIIIIVMLIGTRIAGIIGLILAIPAATVVWVIVSDFIKKSELAKLKDDLE